MAPFGGLDLLEGSITKFFDFDPVTGVRCDTTDGEGDDITVYASQDLQPVLDHTKRIRDSGLADEGIKKDFWHYATIPTWLEIELRSKGINIYDKNCTKDLLRELNTNYPKFKTTRLHHE